MTRKKIILDTDIGDDIDDAFALVAALFSEEVELIGVTTVFGNTCERAEIVKKMLCMAGKAEIPVYAGTGKPLDADGEKLDLRAHTCQYTPDLDEGKYTYENAQEGTSGVSAVNFIVDSVKKYGKELTLVTIGPLTNAAKALIQAPEITGELKIVAMGGDFGTQFREWNIVCDAEAAKVVVESGADLTFIGLDVTLKTEIRQSDFCTFMAYRGNEAVSYLQTLTTLWQNKSKRLPVMHDPLALFSVVRPELVFTEKALVKVETQGEYGRGVTFNLDYLYSYLDTPLEGRRISVAKAVDERKFLRELLNLIYKK